MTDALDVISRGLDSSGRPLRGTRQMFQFYDRVNADAAGGLLVIVQGSFMGASGASASAGTHRLAGCQDWRTWNLSALVRDSVIHRGRELMGAAYHRTAPLFDDHIHVTLVGDRPMDPDAADQVVQWKNGQNGLADRGPDTFPFRPKVIHDYEYLPEDDMFEKEDHDRLVRIEKSLKAFRDSEAGRDSDERDRDKQRFSEVVTMLGQQADVLGQIEAKVSDSETKALAKKRRDQILTYLKNHPDVDGPDNPSDDAMAEQNLG